MEWRPLGLSRSDWEDILSCLLLQELRGRHRHRENGTGFLVM